MKERYQIFTVSEAVTQIMDEKINEFLNNIDAKNVVSLHRTASNTKNSCTIVYKNVETAQVKERYQIHTANEAITSRMDKEINEFLNNIDAKNIVGFHNTESNIKRSCTVVYKV